MLKLRPDQMTQHITQKTEFIDWYVNKFMPDQLPEYHQLFDLEELSEMIKNGRDQAIQHCFNTPLSQSHFITLLWHIGANFYHASGFKAIALACEQPEEERIDAFYQLSDEHWNEAIQQRDNYLWFKEVSECIKQMT